jgi:ketosteroid isomerase-like protein
MKRCKNTGKEAIGKSADFKKILLYLLNSNYLPYKPFVMIGAIIAKQAVKSGFTALNDRNMDAFMKAWSEECVWIYPGGLSVSGEFTGKEKVREWFQHFEDQFPQRKFTVNHLGAGNIFALGGNNVISAQWDLELVNKQGIPFTNSGVTVLTIKGAKVVKGIDYLLRSGGDDFKKIWGE